MTIDDVIARVRALAKKDYLGGAAVQELISAAPALADEVDRLRGRVCCDPPLDHAVTGVSNDNWGHAFSCPRHAVDMDLLAARKEVDRLRAALEAIPCPACNGRKVETVMCPGCEHGGTHICGGAQIRPCGTCRGTGKHPLAQKALRGEP